MSSLAKKPGIESPSERMPDADTPPAVCPGEAGPEAICLPMRVRVYGGRRGLVQGYLGEELPAGFEHTRSCLARLEMQNNKNSDMIFIVDY